MVVTGKRYSADEGKEAGFIDKVVPANGDFDVADFKVEVGLEKGALLTMKHNFYYNLCQILTNANSFNSHL